MGEKKFKVMSKRWGGDFGISLKGNAQINMRRKSAGGRVEESTRQGILGERRNGVPWRETSPGPFK